MAFATLENWLEEMRNDRPTERENDTEDTGSENESDIGEEVIEEFRSSSEDESDEDLAAITATDWTDNLRAVPLERFEEPVGPIHDLNTDARPIDYFHLFVPPTMFDHMVEQTNLYAEQCQAQKGRDKYWKPVCADDIRKYVYINIMFGIHKLPDIRLYWSSDKMLRVPAVADVMGRQRYEKINQYFHLNDSTQMPARGDDNYDPLFKVRPLLDQVRSSCSSLYKPDRHISVDEAMIGFNGRLYFKQYIKNKPTKWGIKVWCVAEASTGYMLNFRFYTGKVNEPMPNGIGHHVVINCAADYLDKWYCVYFDNYFSSVRLAEDLLARNTYSCATVRVNRRGWPFKKAKLKKGDVNMKQKGRLVATEWMDKRHVNILSTCSAPNMSVAIRRSKDGPVTLSVPTPVLDYNMNMAGVDLADQNRSYYDIGRAGKKWWRYAVWFLLQTAVVNSYQLMKVAKPTARRQTPGGRHLSFRLELLRNLLEGSAPREQYHVPPSPSVTGMVTPAGEHKLTRIPGRKKGCFQCARNKMKTASGRGVETVYGCLTCGIHLCKGTCFTTYHFS